MCWALSEGSSQLIPIDEQPNHPIVHLFRLGKAQRATHEPLNQPCTCPLRINTPALWGHEVLGACAEDGMRLGL
jgi:hypothetical protein